MNRKVNIITNNVEKAAQELINSSGKEIRDFLDFIRKI